MPKCPECGKEIDQLIYRAYELVTARALLTPAKIMDYINWESHGITREAPEYRCPECDAVLFDNEEDAEAFLRGESKEDK